MTAEAVPLFGPGPEPITVRPGREQIAAVLFTRRAHQAGDGQTWGSADEEVRDEFLADADTVLALLDYLPTESDIREDVARELEWEHHHWGASSPNGLVYAAAFVRHGARDDDR